MGHLVGNRPPKLRTELGLKWISEIGKSAKRGPKCMSVPRFRLAAGWVMWENGKTKTLPLNRFATWLVKPLSADGLANEAQRVVVIGDSWLSSFTLSRPLPSNEVAPMKGVCCLIYIIAVNVFHMTLFPIKRNESGIKSSIKYWTWLVCGSKGFEIFESHS